MNINSNPNKKNKKMLFKIITLNNPLQRHPVYGPVYSSHMNEKRWGFCPLDGNSITQITIRYLENEIIFHILQLINLNFL